jgi:hypothetical protein
MHGCLPAAGVSALAQVSARGRRYATSHAHGPDFRRSSLTFHASRKDATAIERDVSVFADEARAITDDVRMSWNAAFSMVRAAGKFHESTKIDAREAAARASRGASTIGTGVPRAERCSSGGRRRIAPISPGNRWTDCDARKAHCRAAASAPSSCHLITARRDIAT